MEDEESRDSASEVSSADESISDRAELNEDSESEEDEEEAAMTSKEIQQSKKRKRRDAQDDLEDRYMKRLAEEEARENVLAKKNKQIVAVNGEEESASGSSLESEGESDDDEAIEQVSGGADDSDDEIPQHEALSKEPQNPELEKASRTVFLGNVSTEAITSKSAKKALLQHLSSFISSLTSQSPPHKIESLRFRSTAYSAKLPKKAAFMKKELMDTTTKSTNAYAVYSTKVAAREAVKQLNGTVVLDRHLRVDSVAHPQQTDHRRCVFVGNLDFVDDDSQIRDEANEAKGQKKQKQRQPADVEEGLWREFAKAGTVESVRVIRDQKTRVGKGFAYVQFTVRTFYF